MLIRSPTKCKSPWRGPWPASWTSARGSPAPWPALPSRTTKSTGSSDISKAGRPHQKKNQGGKAKAARCVWVLTFSSSAARRRASASRSASSSLAALSASSAAARSLSASLWRRRPASSSRREARAATATAVILRATSSWSYGSGGSAAAMASGSPAAGAGSGSGPGSCAAVAVAAEAVGVGVVVIGGAGGGEIRSAEPRFIIIRGERAELGPWDGAARRVAGLLCVRLNTRRSYRSLGSLFFLASASTTFGDRDDEAIAGRVLRLTNAPLVEWCAEALEKTLHVFVVRGPFGARSVLARGHRG